jgi:3-deoxy-D-manno-octulosonate 8-phosphate phosphatase (KDO 8-P phosphatase)
VIFDVDGVLTDGSLYLGDDGQEYKAFNSRDGHGMVMLQQTGVLLAVITGRSSEVVRIRMESLGVPTSTRAPGQAPGLRGAQGGPGLADGDVAYVGDDVVDLPVMRRVGLAIAVADAHPLVRQHAHWRPARRRPRGGTEVCELIMEAQGNLDRITTRYL